MNWVNICKSPDFPAYIHRYKLGLDAWRCDRPEATSLPLLSTYGKIYAMIIFAFPRLSPGLMAAAEWVGCFIALSFLQANGMTR